ncbi:Formyltransferase [Trametes punicea]|nr:Formyltransferase [Trametes punicea]
MQRSLRTCVTFQRARRVDTRRVARSYSIEPFQLLFFGRDEFSCAVLRQVLEAKDVWRDIQVVTQPDAKTGRRGSKLSISPLKSLAEEAKLRVHTIPHERSEFKYFKPPPPFFPPNQAQDMPHQPPSDHLLVTASFGRILPNALLNLFLPSRRLNVHPSLLPAYRGPAPIQRALIDGQRETGVCVIEMTERKKGIDSGAIWGCRRMVRSSARREERAAESGMQEVPEGATFPTLRDALSTMGGELLVSTMRDMLAGRDTRTPQASDADAPRAPLITMQDSMVDFMSMTAAHIVQRHRAISHQKPMTTLLKTQRTLQLHDPSVFTDVPQSVKDHLPTEGTAIFHPPSQALIVRCAEDTYLSVPMVRQQDRHILKAKEWWNGVKPEMRLVEGSTGAVQFLSFSTSMP